MRYSRSFIQCYVVQFVCLLPLKYDYSGIYSFPTFSKVSVLKIAIACSIPLPDGIELLFEQKWHIFHKASHKSLKESNMITLLATLSDLSSQVTAADILSKYLRTSIAKCKGVPSSWKAGDPGYFNIFGIRYLQSVWENWIYYFCSSELLGEVQ